MMHLMCFELMSVTRAAYADRLSLLDLDGQLVSILQYSTLTPSLFEFTRFVNFLIELLLNVI